jgi:hypothetical protein
MRAAYILRAPGAIPQNESRLADARESYITDELNAISTRVDS